MANLPNVVDGQYVKWGTKPLEELEKFLSELDFTPHTLSVGIECDIYTAAKILNMTVPDRLKEGGTVFNNRMLRYRWGSQEGRSIDYLHLDCDFDVNTAKELVTAFTNGGLKIVSRSDLQFVVSGPA